MPAEHHGLPLSGLGLEVAREAAPFALRAEVDDHRPPWREQVDKFGMTDTVFDDEDVVVSAVRRGQERGDALRQRCDVRGCRRGCVAVLR